MNRAEDDFPETSVGWGRLEHTEVPCKLSSSLKTLLPSGTENGICLITKIPALLSRHSLEGPGGNWVTWGEQSREINLPFGTFRVPKFPKCLDLG